MFRIEALIVSVTRCSHMQRLSFFVSVLLLAHRNETCSSSTQLRSLAHNKEGELSHPAQTTFITTLAEPPSSHVQSASGLRYSNAQFIHWIESAH
jgi:hypothetical protein